MRGDQSMLSSNPTVATLNQLIRLNIASELGFETAAEHVKNLALKLYLKSYAQQRAQFVDELHQELTFWGGAMRIARNPLAALHRGWIDIKAALVIGRDQEALVVLRECLRGEQVAIESYRQARQAVLPVAVDELLQRQATQIQRIYEQLCRLAECSDDALLVQLFEQPESTQAVVTQLVAGGIVTEQIQATPVPQISAYACHCQRQRLLESSSTGGVLGALAGLLLSVVVMASMQLSGTMSLALSGLLLPILLGIVIGTGGGAIFGFLIGQGITEDDAYFYQSTVQNSGMIVAVQTANAQTTAVRQILHRQRDHERRLAITA